jgi:Rrf2 family protein
MIRISKKVEYALMALKYINSSITPVVTAREISDSYNIPYELLAKILQRLKKDKILISNQGMNGGYLLNKKPSEIQLYTLINSIDGEVAIAECLHDNGEKDCSLFDSCTIKSPVYKLQREIENLFKQKSISDFV